MNRPAIVWIAMGILISCTAGHAKTLEDVLKEKGVITEEDYKEVTRSRPVDYKIGTRTDRRRTSANGASGG